MCIAFPGKIVSIIGERFAVVDIGGTRREICLDIVDEEVAVGDYVLSHAGFAIHRIDEAVARENLAFLKELLEHAAS